MVPNTRFMGCPPQKPVTAHLTWVAPREPGARPVRERPGVAAEPALPALRCSAFSPTAQAPADRRGQGPCAESEPDRPLAQPQHWWTEVRRAATEPIAAALPAQRPAP